MQTVKSSTLPWIFLSVFVFACKKDRHPDRDDRSNKVILDWNLIAFETIGGAANQHSLLNSRVFAMVHVAMHDAVNAVDARYQSYALKQAFKGGDPEVAAAAAAHQLLKTSFVERGGFLDSAFNAYLDKVPASLGKTTGIAAGVAAANALLVLGHNSTGLQNPAVPPVPATKPGEYKVVPPFDFIFAPFWKDSKTFSLQKNDQFRPTPPPALTSVAYTEAYQEVKQVGFINSATRTTEQTVFAKYWYEFSEVGWNRIARNVAINKSSGLYTTARLLALVHMAMADSYIAGWDAKIYYNFWRPFTAIREADGDGNPNTIGDKDWQPLENTPPIQDYPSTHSTLGAAAAAVLAYVYGDQTKFSMQSPTSAPGKDTRSFNSFSAAAQENADSRVMAGIHFRFACKAGLELGGKIGQWTVTHHLRPLR